jgi:hypothetical protein
MDGFCGYQIEISTFNVNLLGLYDKGAVVLSVVKKFIILTIPTDASNPTRLHVLLGLK